MWMIEYQHIEDVKDEIKLIIGMNMFNIKHAVKEIHIILKWCMK